MPPPVNMSATASSPTSSAPSVASSPASSPAPPGGLHASRRPRLDGGQRAALLAIASIALASAVGLFDGLGMHGPIRVAFVTLLVAACLWVTEAVPLFVTSFVILILNLTWLLPALKAAGSDATPTLFLAPFFSDIILLFLGGFVVSAALSRYGIDERLARFIIARTGHSVPLMVGGVLATSAFLSMWLSNTATAAMMLALCVPIANNLPASDPYRKALILAVPFGANVGGMATPVGTPANAIAIRYINEAGLEMSFGRWLLIGVPGAVVMLGLAWFVLLRLYRGQAQGIQRRASKPVALGRGGKLVTLICLATALGWMTTGVTGLSVGTVSLLPLALLFGLKLLKPLDLRALSWDVLLVMGGGLTLGRAIEASGLAAFLLEQMPMDTAGRNLLVAAFAIGACIMSSVMSNTATANLLMPIVIGMQGESVPALLLGVAFGCSLAMPLPVSTPPNAMAFGTGELSVTDLLRPGLIITGLGVILAVTSGLWWWSWLGAV